MWVDVAEKEGGVTMVEGTSWSLFIEATALVLANNGYLQLPYGK